MKIARSLKCIMMLSCIVILGCSGIPPKTPILLEKTSERIKTRSIVVSKTLRTVLDESTFTKGEVEEVRQILEDIDKSKMSEKDQKSLDLVLKRLVEIENALDYSKKYASVPAETERILDEVVASLNLVQQIISAEVDKNVLIQNMIDIIQKSKGGEK